MSTMYKSRGVSGDGLDESAADGPLRPANGLPSTLSESSTTPKNTIRYASLFILMVQNAAQTLVMRYVRVRPGDMFVSTTAVVMSESIKCLTCLLIIFHEEGHSILRWWSHLCENIFRQPLDCLKISVPAVVYMLQNNLLYVAASNLEAATYQVTYQLKILTTALFSVVMLRKELSRLQWVSLLILFFGVALVQVNSEPAKKVSHAGIEQNQVVGLVAVIVACLMSGFAGVYFEKLLKNTPQSVFVRNVQLGFIGAVFGLATVAVKDGAKVKDKGFFFGYDFAVWSVILLMSVGGLVVAVVVKYADNILKGFATSGSIILACVASVYFFEFRLSVEFCLGTVLVILSVFMYGKFMPVPKKPVVHT